VLPTQLQIGNTNGKNQKSNAIIRSPLNGTGNIADTEISPMFQENKRALSKRTWPVSSPIIFPSFFSSPPFPPFLVWGAQNQQTQKKLEIQYLHSNATRCQCTTFSINDNNRTDNT